MPLIKESNLDKSMRKNTTFLKSKSYNPWKKWIKSCLLW